MNINGNATGCSDQIFILRSLTLSSVWSGMRPCALNFKQEVDSEQWSSLWMILRTYEIPPKIISQASQIYQVSMQCYPG